MYTQNRQKKDKWMGKMDKIGVYLKCIRQIDKINLYCIWIRQLDIYKIDV